MSPLSALRADPLRLLLVFVPAALVAEWVAAPPVAIFALSLIAIVPLAKLLGDGTEALSTTVGPTLGGLLNATLGNAAELIITLAALRAGLTALVVASITGSILGNLLLITGLAALLGGLRHGVQHFDREHNGLAASQMVLAMIALGVPTVFAAGMNGDRRATAFLSDSVAVIMLLLYALSIVYTLRARSRLPVHGPSEHAGPSWGPRTALAILGMATVAIALVSETLVGAAEPSMEALGMSEFFVGIILIPLVGNAAEHMVAVKAARANKMDLALSISLGSSTQIALLVAPVLVLASWVLAPEPMLLVFNPFELMSLVAATAIGALIALDGESNWMEGAQLLAVYAILACAFFFLPLALE